MIARVSTARGKRRIALIVGLVLLVSSAAAWATGGPTITEYGNGLAADGYPVSIVTGPEGNLWFSQTTGVKAIARITTKGVVTMFKVAGSPRDVAVGPEGKIWYTGGGGSGQLGWVNPYNGELHEYNVSLSGLAGITTGHEGDLWFVVEGGPEALLVQVVPSPYHLTEYKIPTANSHPSHITVGPEGDIWFTESNSPGAIGRFDPATKGFTEFTEGLTVNSDPSGITTGPEGMIWFTEASNAGAIGRIDPSTGAIQQFFGLTAGSPQEIATGKDGNLYFTEAGGNGAIGRITPAGKITEYTNGLTPKNKPLSITSGPEGNIWFTEAGNPAKIGVMSLAPGSGSLETGSSTSSPGSNESVGGSAPGAGSIVPGGKPTIGQAAVAEPTAGTVSVKTPSSSSFVTVDAVSGIPIGSVIDVTHGKLRLVTALPKGRTQSVTVWGGAFRIGQSKTGDGLTTLRLTGPRPTCIRHGLAHTSSAKPKSRKLWAKDNHGRYRSYGSYSATTVLGTEWETVDSCAGTLTRVVKGKVRVSNLHTHKTVRVSAGHSYLARP
jgi:streptogramin lyase